MQIRRNIMTQQCKERTDRKRLITALKYIEVYRVLVVEVAEEGDDAVDGDEEEDADDVALFVGLEVVGCVHEDQEEAYAERDEAECAAEEEAEVVECEAVP